MGSHTIGERLAIAEAEIRCVARCTGNRSIAGEPGVVTNVQLPTCEHHVRECFPTDLIPLVREMIRLYESRFVGVVRVNSTRAKVPEQLNQRPITESRPI